ncbi:pro-epidermal growth factor-like [Poeciliopsis prolifica]|uniref:pro-epidermal growth factor-like n=1 Tax=Poeciliopsis prolifica TaxID=188132 RepID=UPI0024134E1B|nr:pro-epidermal growth factor-like [Poeciliopsis prolifica]XP_054886336.1 pro-epidermal growth factor-like [Poeciliopsis prolifica]
MLAAMIKTALVFFLVQSTGNLALGAACWDERLSGAGRNSSCTPSQPFLLFGHGKSIHRMSLGGKNHRRLVAGTGSSILLDFHFREERLYWANRRTGSIYKASVQGAHRQKLYSSAKDISGLTVDWVGNGVFWTSSIKGQIKKMDLNGKNERTILRHLSQPKFINVDPTHRFLFWLSGGSEIQRSDLSGGMKMTVLKLEEQLEALSVDRGDKRLFWVQLGLQGERAVASCDYSGNSLHIVDLPLQSQSLGISVFRENVYYTDAASGVIRKINKYTGGQPIDVNGKPMVKPPVDIKVVHPIIQPMADTSSLFPGCNDQSGSCVNVCSRLEEQGVCRCSEGFALSNHGTHCEDVNECAHWNHGCSLGCENIPGSYFCTCPKGYTLLPDGKTCQEITPCGGIIKCGHGCIPTEHGALCVCPEGSVLQEDGHTCTGCSSADRGGCSQLCSSITPSRWQCGCLPGYRLHQDGKRCIATGPPAFLIVANVMDVRRMNPDGTEEQTLVKEPRGTILALDFDPVQHRVYFASISQRTIERLDLNTGSREVLVSESLDSPEGLAIDWVHHTMYWSDTRKSAVDCSTLDGLKRKTVVKEGLEKPRGIAVHPQAKKLFWTDTGAQPVVESATLEGSSRVMVASTGLVSPTGLTIDFTDDRLFWCDQIRGLIETAALDGSDRRVLIENQVGRPFDLAVFEDRLWISEWEHQQIRSVHKRTGQKLQRIHGSLAQPASVVVVHPLAKPGANACLHLNGGCAQMCESNQGLSHCSCLPHFTLSADGKSCLSVSSSNVSAESGDKTSNLTSLKNKTLHEESIIPLAGDDRKAEGTDPALFTEKMIADQNECSSLRCAVSARCVLDAGNPLCLCQEGFTGDGQTCLALDRTSPKATSQTPMDVTTQHHISNSAEKCPPSHDAYCLHHGVCFYFPELKSYACNCIRGYLGARCQFSDLEWLELQQAEKEKERNLVIGGCMVALISIISITACITYCFRSKRLVLKQTSEDNVSEISMTDGSMSETTTTSVPRFFMITENGENKEAIHPDPRRAACSPCATETAIKPMSEQPTSIFKHDKEYGNLKLPDVTTEIVQPAARPAA